MANSQQTKPNVLPDHMKERVLQANITKMEAALLKELRELPFGEVRVLIVKFDGQPVRIEVESIKKSKNLQAKDGLDLDDAVFRDTLIESENLKIPRVSGILN